MTASRHNGDGFDLITAVRHEMHRRGVFPNIQMCIWYGKIAKVIDCQGEYIKKSTSVCFG